MLKPNIDRAPKFKLLYNVGALLDIPTGFWVKGRHGENILLGGCGQITAVTGPGNSFKSTLAHYIKLSAANKIFSFMDTVIQDYDTEVNIHEDRLLNFTEQFEFFKDRNILDEGLYVVTDKTKYYGDKWWEAHKEYMAEKVKEAKKYTFETPFLDRDGKTLIKTLLPTFCAIDSFTEFDTSDIGKIQDDNNLGESGGNTIHMRSGLNKLRLLMELPKLVGDSNDYFFLTAHLGESIPMGQGPYAPQPTKKLSTMKQNEKAKGVTDKFYFIVSNLFSTSSVKSLINDSTKAPEYPKNAEDNSDKGSNDLNLLVVKVLRSKSGPSGSILPIVISQTEGVLPSVTEFNYLKGNKRFGLEGTLQNYNLVLYPDCKLSRTTVRSKCDSDPKLRRALNITSELSQMHQYHRSSCGDILCTAEELYKDIKDLGYDWDMILSETRGWWTFDNDKTGKHFLSTKDLLEMRKGLYKPYWLKK